MYCKHCGKQIADDSMFCEFCGGKQDPFKPAEMPAEAPTEAPAAQEAPIPEAAPAAVAAGMAFSSGDGFTSAPAGGNGFVPGAPAPGVPPVQTFTESPAAAPAVEEAVEEVAEEPVAAVEEAVEEVAEEPVAAVEEAVEEVAEEPVAAVEEVVEEVAEEPAAAVEEAVEEVVEEAAPAADDGFTQAAPANDGFTQAAPVNDGFTQAAPANDGFTQAAGAAAGAAGFGAAAPQNQGMPLDYNQTQGQWTANASQGQWSADASQSQWAADASQSQWATGAPQSQPANTMPQGDYMGNAVPQKKKGGAKKILIPIAIIVGLLVIGGIAWAVTGGFGGGSTGGGSNVDPATYKENCLLVPYDELFDELDSYAGENVEFTGEVFEIKEEDGVKYLLTDTVYDAEYDMYFGGTIIIKCNPDKEGMPDVETWDEITVYGIVEGDMMEFESEYGDYTVPVIDAQYIDFEE